MQHKQPNRIFTYVAGVATVAIAAALIAVGAPTASAAPRVIQVGGVITAFTPKTINVSAGETVSICLKSNDTNHDLTIASLNFKVVAPTGPAVCKTLTAPTAPGSHKFICSISGHEAAGMVGSLVVGPGGGGGGGGGTPGQPLPKGPPATGGGSTAGLTHVSLLMLGGGLLIAAMMSGLLGVRVTRRD